MADPLRRIGVWHATVWQDEVRPGRWVIRVAATPDVDDRAGESAVCPTPDEACALLRDWLARVMR